MSPQRFVPLLRPLAVEVEDLGRPAVTLPGSFGQHDIVFPVDPRPAAPPGHTGARHCPRRRVLALSTHNRHPQQHRRLQEWGLGVRPVNDSHLQFSLEVGPLPRVDRGQVLGSNVHPSQKRQRDDSPHGMDRQESEYYTDVAVNMWRSRRAGSQVVMNAGSLDERPVQASRCVVNCHGEPR